MRGVTLLSPPYKLQALPVTYATLPNTGGGGRTWRGALANFIFTTGVEHRIFKDMKHDLYFLAWLRNRLQTERWRGLFFVHGTEGEVWTFERCGSLKYLQEDVKFDELRPYLVNLFSKIFVVNDPVKTLMMDFRLRINLYRWCNCISALDRSSGCDTLLCSRSSRSRSSATVQSLLRDMMLKLANSSSYGISTG